MKEPSQLPTKLYHNLGKVSREKGKTAVQDKTENEGYRRKEKNIMKRTVI